VAPVLLVLVGSLLTAYALFSLWGGTPLWLALILFAGGAALIACGLAQLFRESSQTIELEPDERNPV
jgi:hypothetical protein